VAGFIELSALWWSIGTVRDLDLIDWTIQEAEHLKTEGREVSDPDGTTSLDRLLAVLEREPVEQASPEDPVAQIVNAPSIQLTAEGPAEPTSPEVVTPPEPDIVLPAPTPLAPTADGWVDAQMSNLLKAIVEPDIYTVRADRDRAVALRWVLRDIRSNRLNWSPVTQYDLQILTIMGLVEMRDDAPVLTNAGVSVIG
jgi:hypothetical protein